MSNASGRARGRRVLHAAAAVSIVVVVGAIWAEISTGLRGTYFTDVAWEDPAYTIIDQRITSDTLTANAPVSPDQPFSVRWFGYLNIRQKGTYAFSMTAEGTAGMTIDETTAAGGRVFTTVNQAVDLDEGPHAIAVFYSHRRGRYGIELQMAVDGGPSAPIRSVDLSPQKRSALAYRAVAALQLAGVAVASAWLLVAALWIGRRVTKPIAVTLTVVTTLCVLAVAYDRPPWIRGPAPYPIQWQWDYHTAVSLARIWPALVGAVGVVSAIAFLSAAAGPGAERRRARVGLCAAMVAGGLFQLGILHLGQGGAMATLGTLTRNDIFTGFFGVAAGDLDTKTLLANYSRILPDLPTHARTHPPGPIMYYRAFIRAFEAVPSMSSSLVQTLERMKVPVRRFGGASNIPSVLPAAAVIGGLGTVLFGLLTCWPVARIAAAAGADTLSAARSGALWVLCPAAVFFLPTFDAVGTFLVASACALGCIAATVPSGNRALVSAFAAGIAAGIALFCSFGAGPMLAAAGGIVLVAIAKPSVPWRRLVVVTPMALLGIGVVFAVPIAWGFDLIGTVQGVMRLHEHYTPSNRLLWLRFNLLDFSIFLGWPVAVWLLILLARPRNWWTGRLSLAMIAILVLIDVADITRSEVGRLWMPLMPLTFAGAGVAASATTRPADWTLVACLLGVASMTIGLHWAP